MDKCIVCDGSGKLTLHKSWIVQSANDFYHLRCGICGGTGESAEKPAAYAAEQKRMREKYQSHRIGNATHE